MDKGIKESSAISWSEIEPLYQQVAKELKARQISKQIIDSALSFIGSALPALSDFDCSAQIAILGIACYNAGVKSELRKQRAENRKYIEKLATDPAEAYRQGARFAIDQIGSVEGAKDQRDLCYTVLRQWQRGHWQDKAEDQTAATAES